MLGYGQFDSVVMFQFRLSLRVWTFGQRKFLSTLETRTTQGGGRRPVSDIQVKVLIAGPSTSSVRARLGDLHSPSSPSSKTVTTVPSSSPVDV